MMQYTFSDTMDAMKPSIIREILKQMSDPTLISFAGGNPSPDSFPVTDIVRISNEILTQNPVGALQYSLTEGVPSVCATVRDFINRHGVVAKDSDALIMTSGSQQVMEFMTKSLCNVGDVIAVEEPAFLGSYNAFRSFGAQLVGVAMEDDGVDLQALEAVFSATPKPKMFYCIPNFQNPTGRTMSLAKRKAVYDLAVQYGVPVLEDDPYGALRFAGRAVTPIKSFDTEGIVTYAHSFSKILCPGMRLACCVAAPELMAKMVVAKQCSDVHTNVWAQLVCEQMLKECDMDAHIAAISAMYGEKANLMMDLLTQHCPQIKIVRPEGGMFLWATLPEGVDVTDFVAQCLAQKLAVVPGVAFMTDDTAPCQSVRLNFSTPSKAQIEQGVAIMANVLTDMNLHQ